MNYNTHVSWVVAFVSVIVLGLILGGVFGLGTLARSIIALGLSIVWLIFDKYMRDRSRLQEQEARGD
ncbi:hypothetical protein Q0N36_05250 [Corynebacterium kefirresidentii]|uniref:DUF2273 domain-containing protein n=1 Tax=Corynebacterium kefirresidentii TaxID=1979527 RepID=A0ABT8Q502_9CORY|nr:hypothetical protein [Corynebacterium kefirresidentii]MCG7241213.1 hypothetical protein [Corynebacterium kefirresidentii]MCG7283485.1 hypothetical protein [Corynebacterium kefirresidentii]MCG7450342.1 hypothetical protein [Corynebacterium kefirresidentii]MCG7452584.1 hypothetical protein [Corynebacterium kefirresidentii]MDN8619987.1 hypothetical protein [Corynebacterium kefirresidentii]